MTITEEDRVAWMRTFLSALEAWKTCLDEVQTVADTIVEPAPPTPVDPEPEPASAMSEEQMAVYAANAQIAQQQYLQQFQFWQQMRAHEVAGWKCPACHNFNYSDRVVCNRRSCGAEKPKVDPITDVASVTFDSVGAAAAAVQGGSGTLMSVATSQFVGQHGPERGPRFKEGFRPMRLCKHLMTRGFCGQSEQCTFAHTLDELHHSSPDLPKLEEMDATSMLSENPGANPDGTDSFPDLRLKKKKELCDRFASGYCSLGNVCSFAHGEAEMGTVGLAVCGKVKTQICRNWEAGRCVYGSNCNNAHGEHEIGHKRPPPELAPPNKRYKNDGTTAPASPGRHDAEEDS